MAEWDIRVAEAAQVLRTAEQSAQQYDDDVARVRHSLGGLGTALPRSPYLAMSVQEFAQGVVLPHLERIQRETAAAFEGTRAALTAYQDGDLEMARRSRSASAQVGRPDAPGGSGAWARVR